MLLIAAIIVGYAYILYNYLIFRLINMIYLKRNDSGMTLLQLGVWRALSRHNTYLFISGMLGVCIKVLYLAGWCMKWLFRI
jgi:hypothetical protein